MRRQFPRLDRRRNRHQRHPDPQLSRGCPPALPAEHDAALEEANAAQLLIGLAQLQISPGALEQRGKGRARSHSALGNEFENSPLTGFENNLEEVPLGGIYQASDVEAVRRHAERVDMPADEILEVADTVVIRPDPQPEGAAT